MTLNPKEIIIKFNSYACKPTGENGREFGSLVEVMVFSCFQDLEDESKAESGALLIL